MRESASEPSPHDRRDEREFFRLEYLLPLRLFPVEEQTDCPAKLQTPIESSCLNVSGGGVLIVLPRPMQPGSLAFLQIKVPDRSECVCAVAQVIRVQERTVRDTRCWFTACKFSLITETNQDLLIKYILHESLDQALDTLAHRALDAQDAAAHAAAASS